jgi:hypothetical protein
MGLAWRDAGLSVCGLTHAPKRKLKALNRPTQCRGALRACAARHPTSRWRGCVASTLAIAAIAMCAPMRDTIRLPGRWVAARANEGGRHDQAAAQAVTSACDDLSRSEGLKVFQCAWRLPQDILGGVVPRSMLDRWRRQRRARAHQALFRLRAERSLMDQSARQSVDLRARYRNQRAGTPRGELRAIETIK